MGSKQRAFLRLAGGMNNGGVIIMPGSQRHEAILR